MCQHNLPCSIVYAHCLLPRRAFASLYVLLFLEKEAEIGGRVYVHSSIAIILMGKRELIALLNLSSWCLVMVERLFLAVPRGCLQFVIVVFPDHSHLLFYCNDNILGLRNFRINVVYRLLGYLLHDAAYFMKSGFAGIFGILISE